MNKKTMIINLVFIGLVLCIQSVSKASEKIKLSLEQKRNIVWALKILIDTKTIDLNDRPCEKVDCSILELLDQEGLIQDSGPTTQAICVVPKQNL